MEADSSATRNGVSPNWEGEVINGAFPVRGLLGGSDHSQVYLTEIRTPSPCDAAIKFVAADLVSAEARLSQWRTAIGLSHPHLVRLLEVGRCRRDGRDFLFAVMDYAEETLSEILPLRALSAEEVQALLVPTLDALAYLHRRNLVHGRLQPSNFLVVGDQLQLASDSIRAAGDAAAVAPGSLYDPPEAGNGRVSTAGDVWALGMTLVEALTQRPPWPPDERSETHYLPENLPPLLTQLVRRSLSRDPAARPTVFELQAWIAGGPPPSPRASTPAPVAPPVAAPPVAAPPVAASTPAPAIAIDRGPPRRPAARPRSPVPAVASLLLVAIVVWGGLRWFHSTRPEPAAAPAASSPAAAAPLPPVTPPQPPSAPVPSRRPEPPTTSAASAVLHEEVPLVPRSASDTIRGHFKVVVRAVVDRTGNVVDETLEAAGPSQYFARLASSAARRWKFTRAVGQDPREWLLTFEFSRDGVVAHADAATP